MTNKQLADKIIAEMQDAELTPDQMLDVIRMVRKKFSEMQKRTQCDCCGRMIQDNEMCYGVDGHTLCGSCMDEYGRMAIVDNGDNENEQNSGKIVV